MAASPEDNPPQEPEIHSLASRDRIETWDRSDNMSLIAVASVLLEDRLKYPFAASEPYRRRSEGAPLP